MAIVRQDKTMTACIHKGRLKRRMMVVLVIFFMANIDLVSFLVAKIQKNSTSTKNL
jgi:hypothetical protein